jgi:dihydrofolate reductase
VYPSLLAAGLIDRLVLMTFPVVLGKGKRIFDGRQKPGALRLVEHFVSKKGVVFATYEPDGEVQTGTFESKPPSDQELRRRETWPK